MEMRWLGSKRRDTIDSPLLAGDSASDDGDDSTRTVFVNHFNEPEHSEFPDNYVRTTKYTPFNFLPKNMFEQFMRAANFYFLVIVILVSIPEISPLQPYSSIVPLVFVLSVTAIKEAIEDYRRYQSDRRVNARTAEVLRAQRIHEVQWSNVRVGDILRVRAGEEIPADLVLLASSEEYGSCFIETANLDGETNLKLRQALPDTCHLQTPAAASTLHDVITCEGPRPQLYHFEGSIMTGGKTLPLGVMQMLLRGSTLRNTDWVYGVVVYTGHQTRLFMNATDPPHKRSQVEHTMNKQLYWIFSLQALLCLLLAIAHSSWMSERGTDMWYLDLSGNVYNSGFLSFFTFVVLLNMMVPISLYVCVEMIKVAQAYLINQDVYMYHEESDTPARCLTSNLNEELGAIKYLFSDKTGTITRNQMEFLECSIAGVKYGAGVSTRVVETEEAKREGGEETPVSAAASAALLMESGRADEQRRHQHQQGGDAHGEGTAAVPQARVETFDDPRLREDMRGGAPNAHAIEMFLNVLAICHTVVPEVNADDPTLVSYRSSSPDEEALVDACGQLGWVFQARTPAQLTVMCDGEPAQWELLETIEFSSARKRMSVVVRDPSGRLMLLCKGADSVVLARLAPGQDDIVEATNQHLTEFGCAGLRTLCVASAELDEAVYGEWARRYSEASVAVRDREAKMEKVASELEQNLQLIGATAIEDKLQIGVPEALYNLRSAGIKIWLLTGDKQETAINIGYSSALLPEDAQLIVLNSREPAEIINELQRFGNFEDADVPHAIVVDGATLDVVLNNKRVHDMFLDVGLQCATVVCCRVSPLQKALVVEMVKTRDPDGVTLSIGDGANDVSMIQEADVGIGISGFEGRQAVMASDYAIAQFAYLQRLLLVHGHWSFKRTTKLILYSFYKNFAFAFSQVWFQCFAGFSGQTVFSGLMQNAWNLVFTALPILAIGVLDQVVTARTLMAYPQLYLSHRTERLFSNKVFWSWMGVAMWQSIVCFMVPVLGLTEMALPDGQVLNGTYVLSMCLYINLILVVTAQAGLLTSYWTRFNTIAIVGSLALMVAFLSVYSSTNTIPVANVEFSNYYYVFFVLLSSGRFWLVIMLSVVMSLMPPYVAKFVRRNYFPEPYFIVQEMEVFNVALPPRSFVLKKTLRKVLKFSVGVVRGAHNRMRHKGFAFAP